MLFFTSQPLHLSAHLLLTSLLARRHRCQTLWRHEPTVPFEPKRSKHATAEGGTERRAESARSDAASDALSTEHRASLHTDGDLIHLLKPHIRRRMRRT